MRKRFWRFGPRGPLRLIAHNALAVLAVGLAACSKGSPPAPISHEPDAAADSVAPAPGSPAAPRDASLPTAASAAADAEAEAVPVDGPYLGGHTWITCMHGFRAESTLSRDLLRLGTLCGPYHGMKRVGAPLHATLQQGETRRLPFEAKSSQCLRVFAVWEAGLTRVSLRALDDHGRELAGVQAGGRFAALRPEGTFCVQDALKGEVELRAEQGHGAFALQVWLLP